MKVPDGGHVNGQARLQLHMDIGRASRYEQAAQQRGLRRTAAIAGVQRTEQSIYDCTRSSLRKDIINRMTVTLTAHASASGSAVNTAIV